MGLLDFDKLMADPMFHAGMGLLSAGTRPRGMSAGAAMAQGLMGGMNNYAQAQQQAQAQALRKMQVDAMRRQQAGMEAFREQVPEAYRGMFDVAPQAVIASLMKPQEAFTLSPGAVRYDAQGKQIAAAPMEPKKPFTRDRFSGDQVIQEEFGDGAWKEIGRGPRFARQVAPIVNVGGGVGGEAVKKPAKMPAAALKMQQDDLEDIGAASGINEQLDKFSGQISSGALNLSTLGNLTNRGRNYLGLSTDESRNLASFQATLEKMRNDSLRLNKGVQTEGDAQRAWNELVANINDPDLVKQRLVEIRAINERAIGLRKLKIDALRSNYGAEPFDFDTLTTPTMPKYNPKTGRIE